jgi:hypothetical protein
MYFNSFAVFQAENSAENSSEAFESGNALNLLDISSARQIGKIRNALAFLLRFLMFQPSRKQVIINHDLESQSA